MVAGGNAILLFWLSELSDQFLSGYCMVNFKHSQSLCTNLDKLCELCCVHSECMHPILTVSGEFS